MNMPTHEPTLVQVGPATVTVRTLSIGEIRAWLRELGERPKDQAVDLVGETLFEDITLRELTLLTDLSPIGLEALTPNDLAPLVTAVLAANPHWAACRRRLASLGSALPKT
jgi:hypothetical protein